MKEKIVLDFDAELKNICNGCAEGVKAKCKQTQKDHLQCALQKSELEEFEVEKCPANWEDVKQLTKEHIDKLKLNKDVWEIDIKKDFIDIQKKYVTYRVRFTSIGNILFDAYLKIAENKTPNELWSFIKSLIGEK